MKNREIIDCLRRMPDIDRPIAFEVDGGDNTHKLFAEYVGKGGSCIITASPQDYDTVATVRDVLRVLFFWNPSNETTFDVVGAHIDGLYTVKAVRQTSTDVTIILEGGAA